MMFTILMKIGQSLKAFRKSKKLGQADIAAIVDTSITTISDWERGRNNPELSKLIILAKHFNVTLDTLAFFDKESKSDISNEELELIYNYRKAPLNIKELINITLKKS